MFSNLKLTVQQYLLASAAIALAIMGIILKWKQKELASARAALLSQKFLNEQDRQDNLIAESNRRVENARKNLNDALAKLPNAPK